MPRDTPEYIIGIDLGITNSRVGIYQNSRPVIIPNKLAHRTTPSIVAFTDEGIIVGETALHQSEFNPENTIYAAKRFIGREFNDEDVQKYIKSVPFKVVNHNGNPRFKVQFMGQEYFKSPEQISGEVLSKMRQIVQSYIGSQVTDAVITVPAYFNEAQRSATKDAAQIAGLNAVRLLNEPTAAAIAYGINQSTDTEKNILVYDLGGGTFDVSLIKMNDGIFEIKAIGGDSRLGGEDIDDLLVDFIAGEFLKRTQINVKDDAKAMARLRKECQKAKCILSSVMVSNLLVPALCKDRELNMQLRRAGFSSLIKPLIEKTMKIVTQFLVDAQMDKSEIDIILLVGGSTKIPAVQEAVKQYFGKEPSKSIEPDEAIAMGAATLAEMLRTQEDTEIEISFNPILIQDFTPLTLGMRLHDGRMYSIIPQNTPIPTSKTITICTAINDATFINVYIYTGESKLASDNSYLETVNISGIPPAPAGTHKASVTLSLGIGGLLTVTVGLLTVPGLSNSTQIDSYKDKFLAEKIKRMISEAEKLRDQDLKMLTQVKELADYEKYLNQLRETIELNLSYIKPADATSLLKVIELAEDWIDANSKEPIERIKAHRELIEAQATKFRINVA